MPVNLASQPIAPSFFEPGDDTLLTWLGMAGVLINTRGTILIIDPMLSLTRRGEDEISESGYRLKIALPIEAGEVPRADAVLYTHADGDHLGLETARTLDQRCRPVFYAPSLVLSKLDEIGVEPARMVPVRENETLRIGEAEVFITPALHDYASSRPFRREDCCGFLVKTRDGNIWHPGDSRLIEELLTVKGVDVLFFDVAYRVEAHLGPDGSARLAESSGAKDLIAYHYGTFDTSEGWAASDPEDSLPFVKDLPARFLRPNPGEIYRLPHE